MASCLRGALPPVDLRGVCLVQARANTNTANLSDAESNFLALYILCRKSTILYSTRLRAAPPGRTLQKYSTRAQCLDEKRKRWRDEVLSSPKPIVRPLGLNPGSGQLQRESKPVLRNDMALLPGSIQINLCETQHFAPCQNLSLPQIQIFYTTVLRVVALLSEKECH